MEWISMAEQLHASLTSSTMPGVGWSGIKHTLLDSGAVEMYWVNWQITLLFGCLMGDLVDSRRTLPAWLHCAKCKVWWWRDNGMGLFFRGWARPLTSSEGKPLCFIIPRQFWQCYASKFWEQFVEGPFLFQYVLQYVSVSLVWKYLTGPHRALSSTPSSTFGIN